MSQPAPIHALFPGSFDPVTLGHVDVLRRALKLFDHVTVAVAAHHAKRELLSLEERIELLREVSAPLDRVSVTTFDGLLVEGAREIGASAVVRGIRTAADLEYERQMALTNRGLDQNLETVFVLPDPAVAHISSTLVRQIAALGGDVSEFVPPQVAARLAAHFDGPA